MGRKRSSGSSQKAEYVLNIDVIGGFVIIGNSCKPIKTHRVVVCISYYFKVYTEGKKFQHLEI